MKEKIPAVSIIIFKDNKILAVSRRGTDDQWGLPGGKVDPGETHIDAIIREVKEETHLSINKRKCTKIFEGEDGDFYVQTYMYNDELNETPKMGDAGAVGWVSWNDLLEGPFSKYNAKLKKSLSL